MTKRKPRRRQGEIPRFKFRFSEALAKSAKRQFELAEAIFQECGGLDTAMRDISHDGLARLIYVAYDTIACNQNWPPEQAQQFIEQSTAEWFRSRGFVEWYCIGASHCFSRIPPRSRADIDIRIHRVYPKRKKTSRPQAAQGVRRKKAA
jgi:hypothetical protein